MYSLDVICILPHEVVVYDIKFFAVIYFACIAFSDRQQFSELEHFGPPGAGVK